MALDFNTLTSKQKKVFSAIEAFINSRGIPPTVREIGELIGEKTPGAVQGILNRLEQKGVIKREVGMARSIQLVSGDSKYIKPVFLPEIKRIGKRNLNDLLSVYNIISYQPISPDIVDSQDDCFIIKHRDDSMQGSDDNAEEMLIIKRIEKPKNGDIVMVMHENYIFLGFYSDSENDAVVNIMTGNTLIDTKNFDKSQIEIIGKLVGKYRKY